MRITIYVEELLDEYKKGISLDKISENHKYINIESMKTAINAYITKKHLNSIREERYKNINGDEIDKLMHEGCSYDDIIRLYDLKTKTQVINKLNEYYKEHNLPIIDPIYAKKELPIDKIVEDYKNGRTMQDIAEEYGVAYSVIFDRLHQAIPENIRNKNADILQQFTEDIVNQYENGETLNNLARQYHVTTQKIRTFLDKYYQKNYDYPFRPTVLSEAKFRGWLKTINNYDKSKEKILEFSDTVKTKELILKYAEQGNVLIPNDVLEKYFGEEIDIVAIKNFIIDKLVNQNTNNNKDKQNYSKYFEISKSLEEHGYNLIYRAIALLYDLPNISKTSIEEISKVVNNNAEICDAIKLINEDELNEEYFDKLRENTIARDVKLAIENYELRRMQFKEKSVAKERYNKYKELSKNTHFSADFNSINLLDNAETLPEKNGGDDQLSL